MSLVSKGKGKGDIFSVSKIQKGAIAKGKDETQNDDELTKI